jgi:hypothetical protein
MTFSANCEAVPYKYFVALTQTQKPRPSESEHSSKLDRIPSAALLTGPAIRTILFCLGLARIFFLRRDK